MTDVVDAPVVEPSEGERAAAEAVERRKRTAETIRGIERRSVDCGPMEAREESDGRLFISGYASVFDRSYDVGPFTETVKRGAFDVSLRGKPEVHLLVNHAGLPLASTTIPEGAGSLRLSTDNIGLRWDAELDPADPDSVIAHRKVQTGLLREASFAFKKIRDAWDSDWSHRDLVEVSINRGDVSICSFGANDGTKNLLVARDGALEDFERRAVSHAREIIENETRDGGDMSPGSVATVAAILALVADADTNLDNAQQALADLIGVENPDIDQDAELDRDDPDDGEDSAMDGDEDAGAGSRSDEVPPSPTPLPSFDLRADRARLEALRHAPRRAS